MLTIIQPLTGSVVFITLTAVLAGPRILSPAQLQEPITDSKGRIEEELKVSRRRALDL